MAEVPRIVRERLRSQAAIGEHPDANLLSAFAERALTEQERAQVLDHLSRCAECRELAALSALPQVKEERLVATGRVPAAASRSWWRSPVVHWGALTAAALVVLIAVGERMRLREGHSASAPAVATVSSNEVAQKSTMQAREVSPPAAEPKQSGKPAKKPGPVRDAKTLSAGRQAGAVGGGIGEGAGGVIGGKVGTIGALSVTAEKPAPSAAPPSPPAMKAQASADASKIEGPPFEKDRKIDQAQVKAVPVPSAAANETVEVTAAAPALKSEAAALSPGRSAIRTKRASLSPRWSVSDSGAVQRSFDGGRSWKEVAVADGGTFRAVATVGSDVWAGGSGGALYHSADGGEHWARVRVQASGRALSEDIVRVEFADAQNGVVTASTGESWTTSDAGATWRRQ
ncbi:MAG TPA: YCF48-related protein [Terriglobales bacterium]|nr:YCF48-related protein [Terriglobales bacterium]